MSGDSEGTDEPAQGENSRDEIIRKRSFSRARGIDISTFMVDVEGEKTDEAEPDVKQKPPEQDIAMGEIAEIFSKGGDD